MNKSVWEQTTRLHKQQQILSVTVCHSTNLKQVTHTRIHQRTLTHQSVELLDPLAQTQRQGVLHLRLTDREIIHLQEHGEAGLREQHHVEGDCVWHEVAHIGPLTHHHRNHHQRSSTHPPQCDPRSTARQTHSLAHRRKTRSAPRTACRPRGSPAGQKSSPNWPIPKQRGIWTNCA